MKKILLVLLMLFLDKAHAGSDDNYVRNVLHKIKINDAKVQMEKLSTLKQGDSIVVSTASADLNLDARQDHIGVVYSRTKPLVEGQKINSYLDLDTVTVIVLMSNKNNSTLKQIVIDRFENDSYQPYLINDIHDGRQKYHLDIGISRKPQYALGERFTDEDFDKYHNEYENQGDETFVKTHEVYPVRISDYLD